MSQQTILRVQTNIPSEFTVTGATSLDLQSGSYSGITGSGTLSDPFIYSQTFDPSEGGFNMTFQAQCDGTIVISYLSSTAVQPQYSFDNHMSVTYWGNRTPSFLNDPISHQNYYGKQINQVKYDVKSGDYLFVRYTVDSNISGSTVSGSTYFIPNSNSVNYTPPTYDNLDLYSSVPIKINKSFAELQDIGKKNSDFSVNLTLPGTKKNNRFFETFYNVDMSLIFFDVTKRVPCDVLIEDQSYFRGYLKLNKIKVKDSAVEYDVTLYSTVSDIFGKIGNNLLRDLNFNDAQYHFNHQFHWKNIVGQYQLDPNLYNYETPQSYFYPILHNGYNYDGDNVVLSGSTDQTRLYTTSSPIGGYTSTSSWYSSGGKRWRINSPDDGIIDNQLKPSLTIYNLVKLMFKDYGYTIDSKFFETPWFKNLTMYGYFSSPDTKLSYIWQPDNCLPELGVDVLYDDYNNLFHVVKAGTNVPATACQTLTGVIRYQDEYGYDYIDFEIPPGQYSSSVPGYPGLIFEGIEMYNFNNWYYGIPDFDPLANEGKNVPVLDDEIVDFSLIMDPKIKQIDFLSSLAKKFNLVFTPSPDYPNEIIIEPYDYYMNTGEIHDWTEKLSYDQGFTVEPALNYIESTLKLTDSEDGDDGNKLFKDTYNRLYGEQIVYNTTDFKSSDKEIKTIFSPEVIRTWDSNVGLPLGMNYVGSSSENDGGNVSYQYKGLKSKPKIFYWLGNFPPFIDEIGKLYILNNVNTNLLRVAPSNGVTPLTGSTQQFGTVNAPVISPNSTIGNPDENKIINDNITTLFGSEKPVDLGVSTFDTYTANNLYNTFYQNRIQNLYDKNTRFISGKFNLKLSDILNLNPNDLIKIHEQYFTWNKIKEFNMTEPELTQVELIQTNRVIKEYPDRYFIYKYCDGGQYEYKFKTYFDYTEAQQPGGDRYLINGYSAAVMSNYYWATLYDYFVGALGGDVSGYTSVNESFSYGALKYEIREVTKAEWESTTALLWNLDPAKDGLYQLSRQEPSWENAGFDYPLYMALGTQVILNLAANCTDMGTYLSAIGRTPSNPPAPPSPTPVPTSTPTPTPTPTEIVQGGIIGEYSVIINYNDDTEPDARLTVYLDGQVRVNRYNNTTPLYMTYSNGDERFEVTVANYNTSLYNNPIVELIRRDYTNDDQNGNMGIVDTIIPIELVNVLPNQVYYDWGTLTTNPDAYNCEYRLSVRTGTPIGEPTPTPTSTPAPTPQLPPGFIFTIDTTKETLEHAESPSDSFVLPLNPEGVYDFTVYWGDGSSDAITDWNTLETGHQYAVPGVYQIRIVGQIESFNFGFSRPSPTQYVYPQIKDNHKLKSIEQWDQVVLAPTYVSDSYKRSMFKGCVNLGSITATDVPQLVNHGVTSLESWFESTQHLENFTALNSWEVTQSITNISKMFLYSNLRNVTDLSNWYTINVTDMSRIFYATQFNGDISTWDTGNVTNMLGVFAYNQQFNQDISGWNVSNVTSMNIMFQFASSFNQDISSWNVGNVLDMDAMFIAAGSFNQDLSGWCVTNIPTEPYNFAEGTNSWILPKPIWGTCP